MSACRIVGGNLLARGTTTLATGTTDSNYPLTNIYDGIPGTPWRAGAAASTFRIKVDGNLVGNGGLETWSDATTAGTWTESNTGTGAGVAREGTTVNSGTYAALFTAGTGTPGASLYQDITVRSGEQISVSVALRGDGTGTMRASLRNLTTGYYLTTSGTWQAASTDFATRSSSASYATTTKTPTVEAYSVTGADTCTLRLTIYINDASRTGYADDCYLWPYVDFASIHGHTLSNKHTVTLERSTDGSAWTSEGTMTVAPGAFYLAITSASYRYWSIAIADATALTAPQIGEAVLGQSVSLSQPWRHPTLAAAGEGEAWPQVRLVSPGGSVYARRRLDRQTRSRALTWQHTDATTKEQLLDELWRRTLGGTTPVVLIPWDSEAVCLYGRVDSDIAPSRVDSAIWQTSLTFLEEPGPATGL